MVLSVRLQQSFLLSGSDGSVLSINVGTPSKNPECSNTADCCAHPYNICGKVSAHLHLKEQSF